MTEIVLLICLDGCGPEYLHAADMPSLKQLASAGRSEVGLAVMPTVTNVNNTSIVTGNFPRAHGITSNWCLDPVTRKGRYMESADDLLTDTIFERLETRGVQSAFLCVKEKLVHLLGRGATVAVAAENPPQWLIEEVGPVPSVYSAEINLWIFEALLKVILRFPRLGFVYLATTDYIPHRHAAEETASQEYLSGIDDKLKAFLERHPEAKVGITADHGMTHKKHGINPACSLVRIGQNAMVIPIIRDRYTIHHSNLSGAAYIYLEQPQALEEARSLLGEVPGIEIALTREQAVEKFQLYSERIGDLMVVGDRETVFGELPAEHTEVNVRSHGSHHERSVPIISYGIERPEAPYEYNKDLIRFLYREETNSV